MITPEQQTRLSEHFPDHKIERKPKGNGLDYINHGLVTERLLEVDPNWSWEPLAFDERGFPAFDEHGGLWIKMTVCGVTRLGYGDSEGQKGPDAVKGAISDAIKIAAARFGVALHIWSQVGATAKAPKPAAPTVADLRAEDAAVDDMLESIKAASTKEDLKEIWTRYVTAVKSGRVSSPESINLIKFEFKKRNDEIVSNLDTEPPKQPENGAGGDKLWPDTTKVPAAGLHP